MTLSGKIIDWIYEQTSQISDEEFVKCLEDVISSLQSSVDAKLKELAGDKLCQT